MKHLRGHYLLMILAVTVTLVVTAVYFYMSHKVDVSLTKSISLRESVRAANANQSKEQIFLETYEKTEKDWSKLSEFFVSSENVVQFIEAVESLGKSIGSKVTLSSIDADNMETAKVGATGFIRVHVEVEGSWSAVMRTLRSAESLPYKVSVNNVRLEMQDSGKTNAWRLTFDIKATMLTKAAPTVSVPTN